MARFSAQTLSVLGALAADPAAWLHGYLIAKQTGLASGTLYPILIRLAERRLIEARWEGEQPAGRPRRPPYRLTAAGLVAARTALAEAARDPRAARTAGHAAVRALIGAKETKVRFGGQLGGYCPVIVPVWGMQLVRLLVGAGYGAGLLILSARRVEFTRRVLPIAAAVGAL